MFVVVVLFANPESDRCLQTLAVSTLETQSPKALYCCEAHVWSSYLTTVSIPRTQIPMPGQLLIDTLQARLEPGPVEPKGPQVPKAIVECRASIIGIVVMIRGSSPHNVT